MKHTVELQPFSVPNFVRQISPVVKREDGWKETVVIPLSDLSTETLEALCAEFRRNVFEKAGKTHEYGDVAEAVKPKYATKQDPT